MIDRLVHAAIIGLKGDSYRLKDRDLGRVTPVPTNDEVPHTRVPQLVGIRAGLSERWCLSARFGGPRTAENGGAHD